MEVLLTFAGPNNNVENKYCIHSKVVNSQFLYSISGAAQSCLGIPTTTCAPKHPNANLNPIHNYNPNPRARSQSASQLSGKVPGCWLSLEQGATVLVNPINRGCFCECMNLCTQVGCTIRKKLFERMVNMLRLGSMALGATAMYRGHGK